MISRRRFKTSASLWPLPNSRRADGVPQPRVKIHKYNNTTYTSRFAPKFLAQISQYDIRIHTYNAADANNAGSGWMQLL